MPNPTVTLNTSLGSMRIELFADQAPQTVANFVEIIQKGWYTGTHFHRIISGFMIQGGCPQGTGTGSRPDGKRLVHEGKPGVTAHVRGSISMARSNDPDSASCQFFICHGEDVGFLDPSRGNPGYVAFGKLADDESFAVLDKIAAVPVVSGPGGEASKPTQKVQITSASVG